MLKAQKVAGLNGRLFGRHFRDALNRYTQLLSLAGTINFRHMSEATVAIRSALEGLSDLPAHIHDWRINEGLDSTNDPAVWICAIIDEDTFNPQTYLALTKEARSAAQKAAPELWPYISVQSLSEQDATK